MSKVSRCCLACDYQIKTYQVPKDEYQEVTVCPKCNGAFVDMFKLGKYKQLDNTKVNEEPLLQIVQSDIDAVPVVLYKGEEIKQRIRISFDWKTNINRQSGAYIHIEHGEADEKSINTKIIQHNHPIVEEVEEVVKLVCKDCGISITGKRVSLEGKGCIHSVTHNTTLVPLDKEWR
ncbi:hypothetical protein QJ529_18725 [Bacillus paranthracis]|uniref:hypothetical protein n=1 Tax=Bacillus TaxID=1386 RepID=UPI000CCC23F6|nr:MULTISPECIES: hypothetical protein [Bacillus]MDO3374703.1 hypothetical protein [Bacillus paranthracis]PNS30850.1 hypothetical protein C1640_18950 [Bacillus sp. AKBS9]